MALPFTFFFFSRVLFAWLCFDDFLRLLLPLIFSPTYHLPKLWAPQGLGAGRRKEQSPLSVKARVCPQSPPSYLQPSSVVLVFEGAPGGSGGQASSCFCFSMPWTLFLSLLPLRKAHLFPQALISIILCDRNTASMLSLCQLRLKELKPRPSKSKSNF